MEIPNTFRKNGFTYQLIQAGVNSCVFEQLYSIEPKVSYFEVFKLRIQKGGERWGKTYEDKIRIPENEAFGNWAWTFRDKDKAIKKFKELENELSNQH